MTTPIIRWAGSKRKLLPKLLELSPKKINTYIEPFAGSCCLFYALKPEKAILSDFNSELIHFYKMLRWRPRVLYSLVSHMPDTEEHYYKLRSVDAGSLGAMEKAARFIYLNRYCFNGVYRTNAMGKFNVPRGNNTGGIPPLDAFISNAKSLKSASLYSCDFEKAIKMVKKGDFVYLDPPYAKHGEKNSGEYGVGAFDSRDFERFVDSLLHLSSKKAQILVSYRRTNEVSKLLSAGWSRMNISVPRHVAGFSSKRRNANEILIANYQLKGS